MIPSIRYGLRRRAAFSMVELLSVMAVVSMLAVATVPAMRGTLGGIQIGGAADIAEAEISLARQIAMSRNLPVEVRFYEHDDGSGAAWRMVALVIPASASGRVEDEWVSRGTLIPGNVVIDDSGQYSTILSNAQPRAEAASAPWLDTESTTAPRVLRGKRYVGFFFRPDGSTNLPMDEPWCITLRGRWDKPSNDGNRPAANFVSIIVDSLTGRTMSVQP